MVIWRGAGAGGEGGEQLRLAHSRRSSIKHPHGQQCNLHRHSRGVPAQAGPLSMWSMRAPRACNPVHLAGPAGRALGGGRLVGELSRGALVARLGARDASEAARGAAEPGRAGWGGAREREGWGGASEAGGRAARARASQPAAGFVQMGGAWVPPSKQGRPCASHQASQALAVPESPAKKPRGQSVQSEAPSLENVPGGHWVQEVASPPPSGRNVPTGEGSAAGGLSSQRRWRGAPPGPKRRGGTHSRSEAHAGHAARRGWARPPAPADAPTCGALEARRAGRGCVLPPWAGLASRLVGGWVRAGGAQRAHRIAWREEEGQGEGWGRMGGSGSGAAAELILCS